MKRTNAGFTVIELLTSLTLLSLVIFTFAPLVSFSLAQIVTAGNYNSALHAAAGELEGAQAQILDEVTVGDTADVTVADYVKTTDMMVVFQKDGVTDSSGTKVEYATGTELQPSSSSNLLDDLLAFVGMKVEGSLSLNPPIVHVDETFPLTIEVIPNGFTFRDQLTVNAKMKLIYTDASGNDQVVPGLTFTHINENLVRFTLEETTLSYDNSPYRLYYGSYFAYQPIELINFEALDLVVAGTDGKVAISTGQKNADTDTYDWVFESKSIDKPEERTINDILWMPNEDPDKSRFIGVGEDGLYFEISEGLGLDFSFRANSFDASNDDSSSTLAASSSGDINQAVISATDPTKIDVAGVFNLGGTDTAGQFTLPTSVSDDKEMVTGVKSAGATKTESITPLPKWWYSSTTIQHFESYYGYLTDALSSFLKKVNVGTIMNGSATAIASGKIGSTTYTLSVAENGYVIYSYGTTADAMVFSKRSPGNGYWSNVYRKTVPSIINNQSSTTVMPTSIAYGDEMFMLGMDNGSIFCITAPAKSTDDTSFPLESNVVGNTDQGFGWRERISYSGDNQAITSITYDADQHRWIAVGENGLVLYRNEGEGGTTTWTKLNVPVLSGINLTEVKYIPAASNGSSAAEYFVLGEKWTIAHVDATSNITNTSNWKKDTVYSYYDVDDPSNNVPINSSDGEMTFNTVARRLEG